MKLLLPLSLIPAYTSALLFASCFACPALAEEATSDRIIGMGVEAIVQRDGSVVITETFTVGEKSSPIKNQLKRCFPSRQPLLGAAEISHLPQIAFVDKEQNQIVEETVGKEKCLTVKIRPSVKTSPKMVVLQYLARGLISKSEKVDFFLFPVTGTWPVRLSKVEAVVKLPQFMLASNVETRVLLQSKVPKGKTSLLGPTMKDAGESMLTFMLDRPLDQSEELLILVRMPKGFIN